jgi:hypothetical protein
MLKSIERGRIHAGEAGLSNLAKQLRQLLDMPVDISIVRIGSTIDQPSFIGLP